MFQLVSLVAIIVIILLGCLIINLVFMRRDPHIHLWPAVTSCRLCDKRIWVWQGHEYRQYKVKTDNPDGVAISCGMGGIVHKRCKGTPEVEIGVRLG